MKANSNRDLLVLLKNAFMSKHAIEQEVECLHELLIETESFEAFCSAHELVDRNRITIKPLRLHQVFQETELPAFRFLINKN